MPCAKPRINTVLEPPLVDVGLSPLMADAWMPWATGSGRIDTLGQKVDRFREELSGRIDVAWLAGTLVATLVSVLGLLGAALFGR